MHYRIAFDELFDDYFGDLKAEFEAYEVDPVMFTATWVMSVFTHAVPLKYSHRLWTLLIQNEWMGFYRIAFGVLYHLEDEIMET